MVITSFKPNSVLNLAIKEWTNLYRTYKIAYLGCCYCLYGGSYSDNEASLNSTETVLELQTTGTELGKNYIKKNFLIKLSPNPRGE